ncbi:hypothetical protein SPAN111604_14185 [Sphingomonas antarctica]
MGKPKPGPKPPPGTPPPGANRSPATPGISGRRSSVAGWISDPDSSAGPPTAGAKAAWARLRGGPPAEDRLVARGAEGLMSLVALDCVRAPAARVPGERSARIEPGSLRMAIADCPIDEPGAITDNPPRDAAAVSSAIAILPRVRDPGEAIKSKNLHVIWFSGVYPYLQRATIDSGLSNGIHMAMFNLLTSDFGSEIAAVSAKRKRGGAADTFISATALGCFAPIKAQGCERHAEMVSERRHRGVRTAPGFCDPGNA